MKCSRKPRIAVRANSIFLLLFVFLCGLLSAMAQSSGIFIGAGTMTTARSGHTATLLFDGKVLIAGGYRGIGITRPVYEYFDSAELYDPATKTFAQTGNMVSPRHRHSATQLVDGKVLITGGWDQRYVVLASAELYDPATGTFTPTGEMSLARVFHTATLLPDGKVLIAGGFNYAGGFNLSGFNSALGGEVYDPASGTFTATGNMGKVGYEATATLLANGKVLIAGGETGAPDLVIPTREDTLSGELYDPFTDRFSPTGNMFSPRYEHKATLLADGAVLVTGGWATGSDAAVGGG